MSNGGKVAIHANNKVGAAGRVRELEGRIRDLERLWEQGCGGGNPTGGCQRRLEKSSLGSCRRRHRAASGEGGC